MSGRVKRDGSQSGNDPDAVRTIARNPRGRREMVLFLILALFLVACSAGYVLTQRRTPTTTSARTEPAAAQAAVSPKEHKTVKAVRATQSAAGAAVSPPPSRIEQASDRVDTPHREPAARTAPSRTKKREREDDGDTSLDLKDFIPPGERPTAGQVIEELHKRGIYDGIAAFPPPGTSPPLVGLAVPDDFELPEGYVRHFQATDDGQPIDAILMFSPDYEFVDENGEPVAIPDNRVVPPELAPAGMPIRLIKIPPNLEPGG